MENKKVEKVHKLLQSKDRELIILGITLALNEGEDWCKENIPGFGISTTNNPFIRDPLPSPLGYMKSPNDHIKLRKGNVAASIGWIYVDFRTAEEFGVDIVDFKEI